jgi:hypothetical protein
VKDGQVLPSVSVRVETPEGTMFVHIVEENDMPVMVLVNIGKAGTNVAAWGDALARMVTKTLPKIGVMGAIEELSGITSGKITRLKRGIVCRSGPEGLALALLTYSQEWFKRNQVRDRPGKATIRGK